MSPWEVGQGERSRAGWNVLWLLWEGFGGLSAGGPHELKAGDPGPVELGSDTALKGFLTWSFWSTNVCPPATQLTSVCLDFSFCSHFSILMALEDSGAYLKAIQPHVAFISPLQWKFLCALSIFCSGPHPYLSSSGLYASGMCSGFSLCFCTIPSCILVWEQWDMR